MLCPFCKMDIEDDSFYCDQCGHEILICPRCNKAGKGKVCTSDGTPLISAKDRVKPEQTNKVVDYLELHLINRTLGIDIKITKNVLIGRTTGDFVDIFGKYEAVSGRHLQISFDPNKGWVAVDLGSTNGTKYNNTPLIPNNPQVLSDKSYLQIANIEFYVEIINKKTDGKTGTVRI